MSLARCLASAALVAGAVGCAHVSNPWVEDGPGVRLEIASASEADLRARLSPAIARTRAWEPMTCDVEAGATTHWPLYFEDPFEDKGHAAIAPQGRAQNNRYRVGLEDYFAMPYGLARFLVNGIAAPISMVVQPPFMIMESDGELSRQALGFDHDATAHHCTEACNR